MKKRLQHFLHPLHLWCLCGGQCVQCFRLYENWLWRPLLRRLLAVRPREKKRGLAIPLVLSLEYVLRRSRRMPK